MTVRTARETINNDACRHSNQCNHKSSDRTRKRTIDDTKNKLRANKNGINSNSAHNPPLPSHTANMAMT